MKGMPAALTDACALKNLKMAESTVAETHKYQM
jgi:hypothetical protein